MSKYSLEAFLEACGATSPLQMTVEHPGGAARYILHQPFAVVGRDPRADLPLADAGAARRHLFLQVLSGRLLCLDLTASSPDGRQPLYRWMGAGAEVRLASSAIRLSEAPAPASRRDVAPHVTLSITGSPTDKAELRIRHPLVLIGHAHACQVRLRDERVSRFHCALVNTASGLWVVDLLGRGGVSLNGVQVRAARFDDGDELRVGGIFTFRTLPALPAGPVPPGDAALALTEASISELPSAPPSLVPAVVDPGTLVAAKDVGATLEADTSASSLALSFARLQQQMAEQFHLTLSNVVSAFREVHRDQMKMVYQELARVQKLTDELATLKGQLKQLRTESATGSRDAALLPRAKPSEVRTPVATNVRAEKGGDAKPLPLAAATEGPSVRPAPAVPPVGDVHDWLSRRVDAIQREREGRWQKIFSLLSGSPPPTH